MARRRGPLPPTAHAPGCRRLSLRATAPGPPRRPRQGSAVSLIPHIRSGTPFHSLVCPRYYSELQLQDAATSTTTTHIPGAPPCPLVAGYSRGSLSSQPISRHPHIVAPSARPPTRVGHTKVNNKSCFSRSLIAVRVSPSLEAHTTEVSGQRRRGGKNSDHSTAKNTHACHLARAQPGVRRTLVQRPPTGGILARRARTIPATLAPSPPAPQTPTTAPHPHWSQNHWERTSSVKLACLHDPERAARQPQDGQARAARFSKTSNLHPRPPRIMHSSNALSFPLWSTRQGKVPPPVVP